MAGTLGYWRPAISIHTRSDSMIKVGDKLPAGTLNEFIEVEGEGCSIGPNSFDIEKSTAGKKIEIGRAHV
jgi:hypothetical protein